MKLLIRDEADFTEHKTIMSLEVAWKLMFRVNNREGADRCVANALGKLSASVTDGPRPYWKQPELWEISLRNNFGSPNSAGVLCLLAMANALATGWYILGPRIAG